MDIKLYDEYEDDNDLENEDKIIKLVEYYLNAFENNDDDKVF